MSGPIGGRSSRSTTVAAPPATRAKRKRGDVDEVASGLHGLANLLHGMTLRLTVLRRDPKCVARQATTIDALGAALAEAAETVARLHEAVAPNGPGRRGGDGQDPGDE